jgi:hypothetical protein
LIIYIKIFYSKTQLSHYKRRFEELLEVAGASGGVHQKMAQRLNTVFDRVDSIGSDIGKYKRRRVSQRTWKDSNQNTLYLD